MSTIDNDAREFGQHIKQGGWRLGLLVARNVRPSKGGRRPGDAGNPTHELGFAGKVSATQFASKAGVSQSHVSTYYRAWELAAVDGLCLHAKDLSPGDEDLEDRTEDDEHTRQLWSNYLEKARKPKKPRASAAGRRTKSKPRRAADALDLDVEDFGKTSVQLSEKLVKVAEGVDRVIGDGEHDVLLVRLAKDLRQTKFVLNEQYRLFDQVLERIDNFLGADAEDDAPDKEDAQGEANAD